MYGYHRARHDPLYTDFVTYSPAVPVFRAYDGTLLETTCTVGLITSPAGNAAALSPERRAEIGPAMWQRILKVLSAGIVHGHDSIVLGAWGCGAFGNDGAEIAELFRQALQENFQGAYCQVNFAILDWSRERRLIRPFQAILEAAALFSMSEAGSVANEWQRKLVGAPIRTAPRLSARIGNDERAA